MLKIQLCHDRNKLHIIYIIYIFKYKIVILNGNIFLNITVVVYCIFDQMQPW